MAGPAQNLVEFTVSELSAAVKRAVEDGFSYVRVRGEISGYRGPHSSGHAYFSLKDDKARLEAVVWRLTFQKLRFKPTEGMEVIATGRLTTFPGSSKYQMVIDLLEPAGVGALMALLEERRKKLAAEGLFDASRKRPLPFLPRVIGVVTSPTGAVIRDILHRLSDRFPVHVVLWPVKVQGETSGAEVAAAIRGFNALPPTGRDPAAGRDHRRPRRRQPRGPVGLQRRDRGARHGRVADPGDRRGRPRDRRDADRPRRRPPRADADRRGGNGGAGAQRADRRTRGASPGASAARRSGGWSQGGATCSPRCGRCPRPTISSPFRAGRSTSCRAGSRPGSATNASQHRLAFQRSAGRLSVEGLRAFVRQRVERVANLGERKNRAGAVSARAATRRTCRSARGGSGSSRSKRRSDAPAQRLADLDRAARRSFGAVVAGKGQELASLDQLLRTLSYRNVLARGFALVRSGDKPVHGAQVTTGSLLDIEFHDGHVSAVATSGAVRHRKRRSEPVAAGPGEPVRRMSGGRWPSGGIGR